jgi:hypothetical protein
VANKNSFTLANSSRALTSFFRILMTEAAPLGVETGVELVLTSLKRFFFGGHDGSK